MNKEEGKKVEEKRSYGDSVELFEQIFKQAVPSVQPLKRSPPTPVQKLPHKSLAAKAPSFRKGIESRERTFKIKLKPSKRASANPEEPQQIDLPVRAQAEPRKKNPKTTGRKSSGAAIAGLTALVILAAPLLLHSLGVLDLAGWLDLLNLRERPPRASSPMQKPSGNLSDKTATPKAGTSDSAPPVRVIPAPAKTVPPEEAVEQAATTRPQLQSQPPGGSSAKNVATSAEPFSSAKEGPNRNEPPPLSAEVKPPTPPTAIEGVPGLEKAVRRPYSLYLGSFSTPGQARKALSIHHREDFPPYAVRMDFGDKGVWYRIFTGHFQTRKEAEAFIAKHQIHGAEVKETTYAVRLGTFSAREAMEKKNALSTMGFFPYTIKEPDGQVSLFTGAFLRKEDAERECRDLKARGIAAEAVER